MKKSRIIALAVALVITLTSVLSLSSCLSALVHMLDTLPDTDINQPINPDSSENETDGSDDSSGGSSGSGAIDTDRETEFLPGSENNGALVDKVGASYRTLLSTVIIHTAFEVYDGSFNGYGYDETTSIHTSAGSGVIYSIDREAGDAYIITNFHVVYDEDSVTSDGICDDIQLYLYGQEYSSYAIEAEYVGGSMNYDIAVLRVEDSEVLRNSLAVAASFADSDKVAVMDECFVVGNPEGEGMSVTSGTVSVDSETLEMLGADYRTTISLRVMRVCAAVNHGNSGGGLYDSDGGLIGIIVAKKTGEDVDNIGYAIPGNLAKNLVENIIDNCDGITSKSLKRVLLGITLTAYTTGLTVDEESGKVIKSELVEIIELSDTCIFKDVLRVGDIITSVTVDGVTRSVSRTHHVIDHMMTAREGSSITITVERDGIEVSETMTVPVSSVTTVK